MGKGSGESKVFLRKDCRVAVTAEGNYLENEGRAQNSST